MGSAVNSQNSDYTISKLSGDIRSAYSRTLSNNKEEQHAAKVVTEDIIKRKRSFFRFSSNNRSAIQQQYELLAEVAKDKDFSTKDESYRNRVEYYYRKYQQNLELDGVLGDNFAHRNLYATKKLDETNIGKQEHSLSSKIRRDFLDLVYMFFHTSMMQKFLNFLNKYRVTVIFYRFTWMSFWEMAERLGWLDRNGDLAGMHIDQDGLRSFGEVFLAYSLAIYGLRLLMVLGLVFKHLFLPEDPEKCRSFLERLALEIKKHWYFFINDTAKEIITFMILFPEFFNVASVYIPVLTGALVLLDLIKSIYRSVKESLSYNRTKNELESQLKEAEVSEDDKEIIKKMLSKLNLQHIEKMSKFLLSLIMNILMLSSFVALTIVAPYAVIPALFFFCVLCRVLDVTSDKFGAYMRAREESRLNSSDKELAQQKSAKLKELGVAFLKTLLIPMILVGLLVVNWQLALIVTAVYLTAEYAYSCSKPKPIDKVEMAFFNNRTNPKDDDSINTDEYDPLLAFAN